jgi:hypothetical protein
MTGRQSHVGEALINMCFTCDFNCVRHPFDLEAAHTASDAQTTCHDTQMFDEGQRIHGGTVVTTDEFTVK